MCEKSAAVGSSSFCPPCNDELTEVMLGHGFAPDDLCYEMELRPEKFQCRRCGLPLRAADWVSESRVFTCGDCGRAHTVAEVEAMATVVAR